MSASCLDLLDHLHGSVSVVGSMNVDYTVVTERLPKPGETVNGGPLTLLPGGKSANQASAAARIGAQVRMFGAVGEDTNADFLLEHLRDAGVDTSHIAAVARSQWHYGNYRGREWREHHRIFGWFQW